MNQKKIILVLAQKDMAHPSSGAAEKYMHNALLGLVDDYQIRYLSMTFKNADEEKVVDRITYIRHGKNLLSVVLQGRRYYKKNKKDIALVIDHYNNHQFFTFLYARKKRVFFAHQLGLDIWPYFYGIGGHIIRWFEELTIRLSRGTGITISESTKTDLMKRGFKKVYICEGGNDFHLESLPDIKEKEDYLLYVGRILPYKRVYDVIRLGNALGRPVKIMGRGPEKFVHHLLTVAKEENLNCEFMGYLTKVNRLEAMEKAYMVVQPSVREGWGLVITESAILGTPSIVYNVPGVVDAVDHGNAGFIADEVDFQSMKEVLEEVDHNTYNDIREKAFEFSGQFTWERTANNFKAIIENIIDNKEDK